MDRETQKSSSSTEKRQMLLMGLVIGLLIGLVIALYAMDYFPAVSSFLFYLLIALFFLALVGILAYAWFKDWILQKIFGEDFKEENAKKDLKQLYEEVAVKYVGQLLQHAPADKKKQAQLATPRLLKLGVWAFTRSWALRLLIAIFVAVGGLLGTMLLYNQNQLLTSQNKLVLDQNKKFDLQNERLSLQNNLLEADRRSSLVFLMSNILDKVDEEIREKKKEIKENGETVTNSTKYSLSKPLINRIVALSRAFQPYRRMEGDSLSEFVSPERGQLFIALMENSLDSVTQNTIVARGDFSQAVIREVVIPSSNLSGANLWRANLWRADFRGANLRGANLGGANLRGANLGEAYLWGARLWGADLWEAELREADLRGAKLDSAKNITPDQLKLTHSLYQCINLDPQLKAQLEKEKPCLFTEEGCPVE